MLIFGITGNTGSGKSTVCKILAEMNGFIIDADKLAHEVILRGQPAYYEITEFFGIGVLNENGEINRKKLGEIVFTGSKCNEYLKALTSITHKYIVQKTLDIITELNKNHGNSSSMFSFAVVDAPLLYESGLDKICDYVVLVTAPESERLSRIIKRDNISCGTAKKRMASQANATEYTGNVDFVIHNDKSFEPLNKQVRECFMPLISGK